MAGRVQAFITVVGVFLVLLQCSSALTFTVQAHKEECFYEEVDVGNKVGVSFQVQSGGSLDIDVSIYDPEDKIVYNIDKQQDGKFTFVAHLKGVYRTCFSNKMSSVTQKTVSFMSFVADQLLEGEAATKENLNPLEESVIRLSDKLNSIRSEQFYLKMRERTHRNTSESTNSRVMWYSLLEAAVVCLVAFSQVYYIRRFFEVKSSV